VDRRWRVFGLGDALWILAFRGDVRQRDWIASTVETSPTIKAAPGAFSFRARHA
jgi:hypothetical protein